jgi:hypothetical protein
MGNLAPGLEFLKWMTWKGKCGKNGQFEERRMNLAQDLRQTQRSHDERDLFCDKRECFIGSQCQSLMK